MATVYKITNPIGQIYVGGTKNIKNRLSHYKSIDTKQSKLKQSLIEFGYENHVIEILEECDYLILSERESFYGHELGCLYSFNLNHLLPKSKFGGLNSSEEFSKKRSEIMKLNPSFKGKKHSDETKELIRVFQTGRKHTLEHRMKVSKNSSKSKSKIILDIFTGVFYSSAKELSDLYKIKHSTLRAKLNGTNKNNTQFKYC